MSGVAYICLVLFLDARNFDFSQFSLFVFMTILDNDFADIYISRGKPDSLPIHGDASKFSNVNNNGFMGNMNSFGTQPFPKEDSLSSSTSSEPSRPLDPRLESSKKTVSSVSALKELVGLKNLVFYSSSSTLSLSPIALIIAVAE